MLPERNRGRLRTSRVPRREAQLHLAPLRRRVGSSRDALTGSWEDALEKDGVNMHSAYSQYSSYL